MSEVRDEARAAVIAEVNRVFDEMNEAGLEYRGTLLAVVYSGGVETCKGTHDGDGVAHVVIGRPADNVVLLGAAHMMCSEVERRIETFNRQDLERP